jgi:hypothetical protein
METAVEASMEPAVKTSVEPATHHHSAMTHATTHVLGHRGRTRYCEKYRQEKRPSQPHGYLLLKATPPYRY